MKISEYIRLSLDEADRGNLESSLLHVCAAIDGTAKKQYSDDKVGRRFRQFIIDHLDIIQHMYGGIDLINTVFPFKDQKGNKGVKFEDILYSTYRCKLAHGDELDDGCGVEASIATHLDKFCIDIIKGTMTLPQSSIYALGFACVLATSNVDQRIGNKECFYNDLYYKFFVDSWWSKLDLARQIIYFDRDVIVKFDFTNHI